MKEFAETKECRRQVLLNALDAEQAVCSGCDLCDARKHADTSAAGEKRIAAQHATSSEQIAFNFITAHRKRYSKTELIGKLLPILNECARNTCGKNTWEHSAIEELLHQLKIAGKIRIMKFPWKYKITIVKEKQLYTKNFSQKMHTVQLKITSRIVPHIIKPSHQRHLIQRHRHLLRKRG